MPKIAKSLASHLSPANQKTFSLNLKNSKPITIKTLHNRPTTKILTSNLRSSPQAPSTTSNITKLTSSSSASTILTAKKSNTSSRPSVKWALTLSSPSIVSLLKLWKPNSRTSALPALFASLHAFSPMGNYSSNASWISVAP